MGRARQHSGAGAPFLGVLMLIQIKTGATQKKKSAPAQPDWIYGDNVREFADRARPVFQMTGLIERSRPTEHVARLEVRSQLSLRTKSIPRDDRAEKRGGD